MEVSANTGPTNTVVAGSPHTSFSNWPLPGLPLFKPIPPYTQCIQLKGCCGVRGASASE